MSNYKGGKETAELLGVHQRTLCTVIGTKSLSTDTVDLTQS